MDYQLIVVGAGPGGYTAALQAAKAGLKTAIVERRDIGGTCLNRGCVPTKALLHGSELYYDTLSYSEKGIENGGLAVDLSALFAHKNDVTARLRDGVEQMLKAAKVDVLRGFGVIKGEGLVEVEGKEYSCEKIIIATGSVPSTPPIPGLDHKKVLTSDGLLDGDFGDVKSITIIGGGVIGIEFAQFFSDIGVSVNVVEGLDRLIPMMDRELGQNLTQLLKKRGVNVYTGAMVSSVSETDDGMSVNFTVKDTPQSVTSELVLCAIGRRPYTEGLFAEGASPEMDGRRISVNDEYKTNIPNIYAIGDVSAKIQLAHVATAQGIACVEGIVGRKSHIHMSIVPSCIYCRPEIASVGLTDAEAKEQGINVKVGKCVMGGNARTVIADNGRSFMKVVANAENGHIIGAQLMCEHSTDMISQIGIAIANEMTAEDMLRVMRPHPTFEESLELALEDLLTKLSK